MRNIAEEIFQKIYKQYSEKNHNYEYGYYLESVWRDGTTLFDVPKVFLTNEMIMAAIETPNSPIYLISRMEFEKKYMKKYETSIFKDDLKDFMLENLEELIELHYDKYFSYNHDFSNKKYYTFFDFFKSVAKNFSGMDTICYVFLFRGFPIPIGIKANGRKSYYMLIYADRNKTLNLVKITSNAYKKLWLNLSEKLDNYYTNTYHLDEYCWEENPSDLAEIPILQDGSYYESFNTIEDDGVIYDLPHSNILSVPDNVESFVIPDGICTIAPKCFKGNQNLKKITIPFSLEQIPESAFMDCVSLEEVDLSAIEGGYNRLGIASAAFCNCKSLNHIDMSKLEIRGGDIVFAFTGIETLDGIKCFLVKERTMSFFHCCSLRKLHDEEYTSTSDFGEFGLACCTSLTSVNLSFRDVPRGLFYGCSNLEEVCIKDENYFKIIINPYAFEGCGKITKIVFPQAAVDIAEYAFKNCHSLSLLSLSKEDQWNSEIAANAFEGCDNVKIDWIKKERFKSAYQSMLEDFNREYNDEYNGYGRYAGTYAQDEAGYSDDEIDEIFDGDPSAYWNID